MSEKDQNKTLGKSLVAGVLAILSTIYLLNPTGISFDTAFDNLPFIGNLDEAAATALLLACLAYFGLDLRKVFGKAGEGASGAKTEKAVTGKVVDGD